MTATPRVLASLVLLALLLATAGCDDTNQPTAGALRLSVVTTGGDLDLDGYSVTVDAAHQQTIGVNAAVVIPDLPTGSHDVALSGVAGNCTVSGQNTRVVNVIGGDTTELAYAVGCIATGVQVTTATTGLDLDLDGYVIAVNGGSPQVIGVNGSLTVTRLAAGTHTVDLSGAAANCAVAGTNPRSVTILTGETAPVAFAVTCVAVTGVVEVSAATSGVDLDPNGYTVQVDGGSPQPLPINDTVRFPGLTAGDHNVTLGGAAGNCTIGGANPRTVPVTTGGATRDTARTTFGVSCGAVTGVIAVTAATSGLDLDPNGYSILVDSSESRAISSNGTTYFNGVTGGSHQVELEVGLVYPNCTVSGVNPRTLAVTTGGPTRDTARTTFQVTCAAFGSLSITAPTSGVDPDPNGYRADAVGWVGEFVDVPATGGTATIPGLPAGDYSVTLSGVTVNCDVAGPNPRTISVPSGGTAAVAFDVTCAQAAQLALALTVNGNQDIYTLKSNGAGLTRLTTDPAFDYGPAWSPDGSKIAFDSYRDGSPEIYVMKADGTSPTRLTTNLAADASPTWSPDGAKIAFVSGRDANGGYEIYVMSADGTNPVRLTTDPADDYGPAWSPDGSKIAFWSTRDGNGEIYVMNPDGLNVTRLTTNTVDDIQPEWSPDGSQLVFSRLTGCDSYSGFCDYDLFVMNADGSGAAQLTSGSSDNAPAWSPDGGSIAFGASFCAPYYYYYYSYGCYYSYSAVYIVRTDGTRVVELLRDAFSPAWKR